MVHLLDPNMLVPVCRLEDPLSWSLSVITFFTCGDVR